MIPEVMLAGTLMTSDLSGAYSPTACPINEEQIPSFETEVKKRMETFSFDVVGTRDIEAVATVLCISDEMGGHRAQIPLNQTPWISHFEQKLFKKLPFPRHWEADGVAKPNMKAKTQSLSVLEQIYTTHELIPGSIAPSIEEGICITYDRVTAWEDLRLIIEVYNDSDIALIVVDNHAKKTIYAEDVRGMDFAAIDKLRKTRQIK